MPKKHTQNEVTTIRFTVSPKLFGILETRSERGQFLCVVHGELMIESSLYGSAAQLHARVDLTCRFQCSCYHALVFCCSQAQPKLAAALGPLTKDSCMPQCIPIAEMQ